MAAPNATPDDGCTTDVLKEVLDMLKGCTDLDMDYVQLARRRLRSRGEQAGQSKRELQNPNNGCYATNLSGGGLMMCCMQTGDKYSYCGSPNGRRGLQATGYYTDTELAAITAECTDNFKVLANETEDACFGSAEEVFVRPSRSSLDKKCHISGRASQPSTGLVTLKTTANTCGTLASIARPDKHRN
jgi:hypothetical protein